MQLGLNEDETLESGSIQIYKHTKLCIYARSNLLERTTFFLTIKSGIRNKGQLKMGKNWGWGIMKDVLNDDFCRD